MKYIISIDIGSTKTKYIIMKVDGDIISLFYDSFIFSRRVEEIENEIINVLEKNNIELVNVEVVLTGSCQNRIKNNFLGIVPFVVDEYTATAYGVLLLENFDRAIIANVGTGTFYLYSDMKICEHLGGSGMGSGAIYGIGMSLFQEKNLDKICEYAKKGNLNNTDLFIKDICDEDKLMDLNLDLTASNLAKINENVTKNDYLLSILNMICQNIGIEAILARNVILNKYNLKKEELPIVFTGGIVENEFIKNLINGIGKDLKEKFVYAKNSSLITCIGAYEKYLIEERHNF